MYTEGNNNFKLKTFLRVSESQMVYKHLEDNVLY